MTKLRRRLRQRCVFSIALRALPRHLLALYVAQLRMAAPASPGVPCCSSSGDDRVGASDASSDAEVEFLGVKNRAGAAAVLEPSTFAQPSPRVSNGGAGGSWACPHCTFLNEDAQARRCEVCDSTRLDAPPSKRARKMSQWLERSSQPPSLQPLATEARSAHGPSERSYEEKKDLALTPRCPARRGAAQKAKRSKSDNGGGMKATEELWAEAYAPASVGDLCVNKKKVEELREWMARNASLSASAATMSQHPPRQRLLFLCGPPGVGKSTAVRCISRELRLEVMEWADNESAGRLNFDRKLTSEFQTSYVSSLNDFGDFVRQSLSYSALPLVAVSRRRGRGGRVGSTLEESSRLHRERKFREGETGEPTASVDSPTPSGHIILLENWPETWSGGQRAASEEKLQQVFRQIVDPGSRYRGFPVVCIYSEVRESKVATDQLSRKFSPEVIRSPLTAVMNINPVTTAVLKRHLTRVVEHERCKISSRGIDNIVSAANGDIRFALNTLQLAHNRADGSPSVSSLETKSKRKRQGVTAATTSKDVDNGKETSAIGRDAFLSDFRVLGKILYGKTLGSKAAPSSPSASSAQPVDYDAMISTSGMSVDKALAFVHENGIGYFSAIEDLAEAMELMSVTENFVAASYTASGNSEMFKRAHDIAQSILIRSIAVANKNPERAGFRPITRPRMYATSQRMVSRRNEWLQLSSSAESPAVHHQYVCSGDAFLFEVEPFMSIMEANGPRRDAMAGHQPPEALPLDLALLSVEVDDEIESSDGDAW